MPSNTQDSAKLHNEFRDTAVLLNQTEIKWKEGPNGIKTAVLSGDPAREGLFTERILFPANWKIAPHWHPTVEAVTVLKGSIYEGTGALFNEAKAKKIDAGGFIMMPAKTVHYAFTKEECMMQVQGYGPAVRTFVTERNK